MAILKGKLDVIMRCGGRLSCALSSGALQLDADLEEAVHGRQEATTSKAEVTSSFKST